MVKYIIQVRGIWMSERLEFKPSAPLDDVQAELLRMTERCKCCVCGRTRLAIDMSKYDGVCLGCVDAAKTLGLVKD